MPEFQAKVALEAIRERTTLAEVPEAYGVRAARMGTCKHAAIDNIAMAFTHHRCSARPDRRG